MARGFFAEMQYQNEQAAKRRAQAERAAAREHAAAEREAARMQREAERALAAAARASAAEKKAAEKEAKRLHEEARLAEVESLNTGLAEVADQLGSILAATLGVDDFVDLETLRTVAEHPPFPRADLEAETPVVTLISAPSEPQLVLPDPPKGLGRLFGGKKRHLAAVDAAKSRFITEHAAWKKEAESVPGRQLEQMQQRDALEEQRLRELQAARSVYTAECQGRQLEVDAANERLDALISGLAAGEHDSVREYIGIVLGNSVYPELLAVEHDYTFDPETRELGLVVLLAPPSVLPEEKAYRWAKAKDEISATMMTKKDLKDRYTSIVHQVALRTLHEVFEADRSGQVQTITLEVGTETSDPATGRIGRVVFVGVAAERKSFQEIDLHNVVPAATLEHLGAAISKNAYDLKAIDGATGVRSR